MDSLRSPWVSKWKIFRAYQNFASIEETYAAPNPFSPDDEVCRIYFKTGKSSASVTIKIFDFAMFPVRTVIQNASRSTPDVLWTTWDGKRDDGSQVANGVYFYRIEIDKDQTVWGKILVLQ
jgi:flagellar hook assembly protein FlgD